MAKAVNKVKLTLRDESMGSDRD